MSTINKPAQTLSAEEILAQPPVKEAFYRAQLAQQQGDFDRSVGIYDTLLEQYGPVAEILNLKANALIGSFRYVAAQEPIESALKLSPASGAIQINASRIYSGLSRNKLARRHALEAVRLEPRRAAVLLTAARIFRDTGDHPRATRINERVLQIEPTNALAWHLKANLAADLGRRDEAEAALIKTLALQPENSRALAALANLTESGLDDLDMVALLEAHRSGHVAAQNPVSAIHALGDIYRREGKFDEAFSLYEEANNAQKYQRPFAIENFEQGVDAVIGVTAEQSPARSPNLQSGSLDKTRTGTHLVFIIGMPRSGTTLLEQVLSAHSSVLGCGLAGGMEDAERNLESQGVVTFLNAGSQSATEAQLSAVRTDYLSTLPVDHHDYQRVIDNNPLNFQRVAMIQQMFPSARFINCVRNPLDTVLSCFSHDFQAGMNFSISLQNTARYFAAQEKLTSHWKSMYGDSMIQVSYEDMVNDLPAVVDQLCGFLDMEAEPLMLKPHLNPRPVMSARRWEIRQPLDDSRVGEWKNYRKQLEPVIGYFQAVGVLDESLSPVNLN
jgi:tetratricopeptide (TPR) repeat protein